jgi:hypothetical protein
MLDFFRQVREAIPKINPRDIRAAAERPIHVLLHAASEEGAVAMADFFGSGGVTQSKRQEQERMLHWVGEDNLPEKVDLQISEQGLAANDDAIVFHRHDTRRTLDEILDRRQELGLPLARTFLPFRRPVTQGIVQNVATENAMFSLATALPNILPNLPWTVGEWASDTAFLTLNQVRMTFLIAAACDRATGFREQRAEIASILSAAFGWRALAREACSKIPFAGGVIPKAAIAFAGTWVAGTSLDRLYRVGERMTRSERREAYEAAFARGREVAAGLLARFKKT